MPKWLFWLALFFVLFLIYTQPADAGNVASGFANFAVNLLSSIGEFLTGLFEGASSSDGTTTLTTEAPSVDPTTLSESPLTDSGSFTHSHSGLGEHTHP